MTVRTSNSKNHFIDTNVLLQHANDDSGPCAADIAKIISESTGKTPTRKLWVSHVIFGELRPRSFRPGKFKDVNELARYIHSIATVVTPDPNMMLRAARLRDLSWKRERPVKNEKPRCLTLGDSIHLVSALWVKEVTNVSDLEFLTFDNSADKSVETDRGTKALPLLSLENYTFDLTGPDVTALISLPRLRPVLKQAPMDFG